MAALPILFFAWNQKSVAATLNILSSATSYCDLFRPWYIRKSSSTQQFIACILKEAPDTFTCGKSSRPWWVLSEPSAAISVIWEFPFSPVTLARAESCSIQMQNSDSDWSDLPGCPQGLKVDRFSSPELKHGSTGPYPQAMNSVRVLSKTLDNSKHIVLSIW